LPARMPKLSVRELTPGKVPDVMAVAGAPLIVSQSIRDVLDAAAGDTVQFVPVQVLKRPTVPYFLLNVLTRIEAADPEKSEFVEFGSPPHVFRRIRKLVLKPVAPGTPAIFRPKELPIILVCDHLRRQLQAVSEAPGIFTPLSRYRFGVF